MSTTGISFHFFIFERHWVEKNCCHWAKDYLKAKLVGLQNQTVAGKPLVKTTELGSFSGDVDLNQRKGKLITIYDVQLKIDWKGESIKGLFGIGEMEDQTCSGTIELPEFMYDYTPESLEVMFDRLMSV
jgi:activator of HSP90 ATPase